MSALITVAMYILQSLFVVGIIGSALVIVLSAVEDVRTLMERGDGH